MPTKKADSHGQCKNDSCTSKYSVIFGTDPDKQGFRIPGIVGWIFAILLVLWLISIFYRNKTLNTISVMVFIIWIIALVISFLFILPPIIDKARKTCTKCDS